MVENKRRAFLDSIPDYQPSTSWRDGENDPRERKWAIQQRRYGFDSRETWSLKSTMIELFYERLQLFLIEASPIVDLTNYKFQWKGGTITQEDAIRELIRLAAIVLSDEEDESAIDNSEADFWQLWAMIHPTMWW